MFSVSYGEILVWIAGFGFSDLLCDYLNIKTKKQRLTYYSICLILGLLFSNTLYLIFMKTIA
jgi:hypothetical protein